MRDCFDKGMNDSAWAYVNRVIQAYQDNAEQIDRAIQNNSKKWNIGHMAKVELSILRLGVCEIKYFSDIHQSITVNECVELAKAYGTEESPRFVNGLLGRVADQLAAGEDLLKAQGQPATGQSVPSGESAHDGQN